MHLQTCSSPDVFMHRLPYPLSMDRSQTFSTNSLESRDAVSFQDFPPDFRHSSGLVHSHHDDSQLPCKHHDSLKDVCPDDGLQAALSGPDETHAEINMIHAKACRSQLTVIEMSSYYGNGACRKSKNGHSDVKVNCNASPLLCTMYTRVQWPALLPIVQIQ